MYKLLFIEDALDETLIPVLPIMKATSRLEDAVAVCHVTPCFENAYRLCVETRRYWLAAWDEIVEREWRIDTEEIKRAHDLVIRAVVVMKQAAQHITTENQRMLINVEYLHNIQRRERFLAAYLAGGKDAVHALVDEGWKKHGEV
jgi:hypothetical protein